MAEREGFEPSRGCYPSNGLANRRLKPLGHLSNAVNLWSLVYVPNDGPRLGERNIYLKFCYSLRLSPRSYGS